MVRVNSVLMHSSPFFVASSSSLCQSAKGQTRSLTCSLKRPCRTFVQSFQCLRSKIPVSPVALEQILSWRPALRRRYIPIWAAISIEDATANIEDGHRVPCRGPAMVPSYSPVFRIHCLGITVNVRSRFHVTVRDSSDLSAVIKYIMLIST